MVNIHHGSLNERVSRRGQAFRGEALPAQRFQGPGRYKKTVVDIIKIGKVCVDFEHPVRLDKKYCADIYQAASSL